MTDGANIVIADPPNCAVGDDKLSNMLAPGDFAGSITLHSRNDGWAMAGRLAIAINHLVTGAGAPTPDLSNVKGVAAFILKAFGPHYQQVFFNALGAQNDRPVLVADVRRRLVLLYKGVGSYSGSQTVPGDPLDFYPSRRWTFEEYGGLWRRNAMTIYDIEAIVYGDTP